MPIYIHKCGILIVLLRTRKRPLKWEIRVVTVADEDIKLVVKRGFGSIDGMQNQAIKSVSPLVGEEFRRLFKDNCSAWFSFLTIVVEASSRILCTWLF